ncbi:MAG: Ig-like domain-containing protein [Planctomycetaceae bacterium]|jgi:hypothetical protein|nr:Ig-like domain-containing protein [Planctomycetaceae bacterium]
MKNNFTKIFVPFIFLAVWGCAPGNSPNTVIVKGTVRVDGQPTAGINVIFNPASGNGVSAGGVTDSNGNYTLTSGSNSVGSGVSAGDFIPTFSKTEIEPREPTASPEEQQQKYGNKPPKIFHLLPEKYSNTKTCGIVPVKVEKGMQNIFNFDLSTNLTN